MVFVAASYTRPHTLCRSIGLVATPLSLSGTCCMCSFHACKLCNEWSNRHRTKNIGTHTINVCTILRMYYTRAVYESIDMVDGKAKQTRSSIHQMVGASAEAAGIFYLGARADQSPSLHKL